MSCDTYKVRMAPPMTPTTTRKAKLLKEVKGFEFFQEKPYANKGDQEI